MAGAIVGLILGSIVGAVATITGSYFLFWRRRRAALDHLRRAFRTELSALSYIDDIGHLSGEKVEALVAFYTDLYWIRDQQGIEDEKERVHEIVEKRQRAMAAIRDAE